MEPLEHRDAARVAYATCAVSLAWVTVHPFGSREFPPRAVRPNVHTFQLDYAKASHPIRDSRSRPVPRPLARVGGGARL